MTTKMTEFIQALVGSKGELDTCLEVNDEQEVREMMFDVIQATSQKIRRQAVNTAFEFWCDQLFKDDESARSAILSLKDVKPTCLL